VDKHNVYSLKGILMADLVIATIIYLLMKSIVYNNYIEIIFLGLALAFINLAVRSFYTNRLFKNKRFIIFYLVVEMMIILVTATVAYVLYLKDSLRTLIFLGGYCCQFIGLLIIALIDLIYE
jgi:hypothetical protein